MPLIFFDGFGYAGAGSHSFGSGDDLEVLWRSYSGVTVTEYEDAVDGRGCYVTMPNGSNLDSRNPLDASRTEVVIGMRLWLNSTAVSCGLCAIMDHNGTSLTGSIVYDSISETIRYVRGDDPVTSVVLSCTAPVPQQQWFYLETHIVFGNSTAGSVAFALDGTAAGSVTGVDTMGVGQTFGLLRFGRDAGVAAGDWQSTTRLKDIYLVDGSTFLGPVRAVYQPCDTAGSQADFTPSAGSNHQNVDETDPDGDTTYNESSTTGDRDSFTHSKVTNAFAPPLGLQAIGFGRAGSDGSALIRIGVRSGATDSARQVGLMDETYRGFAGDLETVDPNTSLVWDSDDVNAAQTFVEIGLP